MSGARDKFMADCGYTYNYYGDGTSMSDDQSYLPCYGFRITVNGGVNTEDRIKKLIRYGQQEANEDETMFFFSVTKKDACWDAWAKFAKDNPNTFAAVVETKSRHRPTYPVRLYIYVKKPRAVKK